MPSFRSVVVGLALMVACVVGEAHAELGPVVTQPAPADAEHARLVDGMKKDKAALQAEHNALKDERKALMDECKDNPDADKEACKAKREALKAKHEEFMNKVNAVRAEHGLPPHQVDEMKKRKGGFKSLDEGKVQGDAASAQ